MYFVFQKNHSVCFYVVIKGLPKIRFSLSLKGRRCSTQQKDKKASKNLAMPLVIMCTYFVNG